MRDRITLLLPAVAEALAIIAIETIVRAIETIVRVAVQPATVGIVRAVDVGVGVDAVSVVSLLVGFCALCLGSPLGLARLFFVPRGLDTQAGRFLAAPRRLSTPPHKRDEHQDDQGDGDGDD